MRLIVLVSVMLAASSPNARAAEFYQFRHLPGGNSYTLVTNISADGSTAVGYSGVEGGETAYHWAREAGMVGLGDLPGGLINSRALGVSADGKVMVGYGHAEDSVLAFRWTESNGMISLGELDPELGAVAEVTSLDGSVVAGTSGRYAFLWRPNEGMTEIGSWRPRVMSDDGSTIYGYATDAGDGYEAIRWTADTGRVGIGGPQGRDYRSPWHLSEDGATIATRNTRTNEAVVWTSQSGVVGLSDLPGGRFFSKANAITADGSTIVGSSIGHAGEVPFIWDKVHGMRSLFALMINQGLGGEFADWRLGNARAWGIADDGLTVVAGALDENGLEVSFLVKLDDTPIIGDADFDGDVDGFDLIRWQANLGMMHNQGAPFGDFNADGITNEKDYEVWLESFGTRRPGPEGLAGFVPVPEPASAGLITLTLGLFSVIRRKGSGRENFHD